MGANFSLSYTDMNNTSYNISHPPLLPAPPNPLLSLSTPSTVGLTVVTVTVT